MRTADGGKVMRLMLAAMLQALVCLRQATKQFRRHP